MAVAGAIVFRSTSSALKSVCVSSLDFGPRSRVFGGRDCINAGREVCRHRADHGRYGGGICRDDACSDVEGAIEPCGSDLTDLESARVQCKRFRSIVCMCDVCVGVRIILSRYAKKMMLVIDVASEAWATPTT
jgi:hypothetical protein